MSKANFTTALEAEAAFYQALAQGNVDALMAVWSEDEEVVCVHPGGPRIVGLAAVRETWRQILSNGNALKIDVSQAVVSAANSVMLSPGLASRNSNTTLKAPGPAIAGLGAGNLELLWALAGIALGALVQGWRAQA